MDALKARLAKTLALTDSLAEGLSSAALKSRNGNARSNTIGAQFWCLVGARESYARAFEAGAWQGFACSLSDTETPGTVQAALAASSALVRERVAAVDEMDAAVRLF